MSIVNLTQHAATPGQLNAGVVDHQDREKLSRLLTFDVIPSSQEVTCRARSIALMADGADAAMIGGAPFLMEPLAVALRMIGVVPMYAFSVRASVEEVQADGSVKKSAIFKHAGFVS